MSLELSNVNKEIDRLIQDTDRMCKGKTVVQGEEILNWYRLELEAVEVRKYEVHGPLDVGFELLEVMG